jgi:uncharacterized damage-inducible protein DinB
MTKDTFTLLAAYNRAANEEMDNLVRSLHDDEWNRELGGYFGSIRSLCSHLYICDLLWLRRFFHPESGLDLSPALARQWEEPLKEMYSLKDTIFAVKDEYLAKRPDTDGRLAAFVEALDESVLGRTLNYTNSTGTAMKKNFGAALVHLFLHHTHHRGMISVYLEMIGKGNDFNMLLPLVG